MGTAFGRRTTLKSGIRLWSFSGVQQSQSKGGRGQTFPLKMSLWADCQMGAIILKSACCCCVQKKALIGMWFWLEEAHPGEQPQLKAWEKKMGWRGPRSGSYPSGSNGFRPKKKLSRDFIHYFFGCLWSFLMRSFIELIQPLDLVVWLGATGCSCLSLARQTSIQTEQRDDLSLWSEPLDQDVRVKSHHVWCQVLRRQQIFSPLTKRKFLISSIS